MAMTGDVFTFLLLKRREKWKQQNVKQSRWKPPALPFHIKYEEPGFREAPWEGQKSMVMWELWNGKGRKQWKVRRQLWIEKRLGRGLKLRRPRRGLETKGSVFEKFFGRRFPETWNEAYTCHIFHKDFSSLSFRPKRSHCLNNSLLDSSNPRYKQSLKRVIFNSLTMV